MKMAFQMTNEDWNVRAVISKLNDGTFEVYIEPITGPTYGLEKTFVFQTVDKAFSHAEAVLGLK
jgi:hypothetical protein